MGFPFFSLSKSRDLEIRRNEDLYGNTLEIYPNGMGLPTICGKNLLICDISQVMERLNRGDPVLRRFILHASDMLEFANRTKGGKDHKTIEDALLKLSRCRVAATIVEVTIPLAKYD